MRLAIAVVAGLWFALTKLDFGYQWTHPLKQPFVMALVFGLMTGDVKTAMILGGTLELLYIGIISPGANIPTDEALAGAVTIPIALLAGMDAETAVILAIPVGILGVLLEAVRKNVQIWLMHKADKYAEAGDVKGIERCAVIWPIPISLLIRFPGVFLGVYFGADFVQTLLDAIPDFIQSGLQVAGGILPALGFAITLNVIGKREFIPFFIIGYFMVQYFELGTLGVAIFAICAALLITVLRRQTIEEAQS